MRFTQGLIYWSLFAIFFSSVAIFVAYLIGYVDVVWNYYYWIYIVLALAQTWFVLILLFLGDVHPRRYPRYNRERIAIIVPCYNEDPVLLREALTSMVHAKGNKDIYVIDDGSTKPGIQAVLLEFVHKHGVQAYRADKNIGKRAIVYGAISSLIRKNPFVVMVDSDTILDENALLKIVAPLKRAHIGAVSGDVRLLNEKENTLTRMIAAYYWTSIHVQRKAQSTLGMVACCSGALSAYKTSVIISVIDDYLNEEFMGERCKHSEDRHLTNLVLRQGHDVVLVPEAVAYTHSPSSYRAFMRQQLRWRRGFFQEATFALTNLWKVRPLLCCEILIWDVVLPFLSCGIVLMMVLNMIFNPIIVPGMCLYLVPLVIIRNLPAILNERRHLAHLILFSFFSSFIMYWQSFYALFTLRNMRWITR